MRVLKIHHNENRFADYQKSKEYANAIYDKYFEMAMKEGRFSDEFWPEQKQGIKYGKNSAVQIWLKMPGDAHENAIFNAIPQDRSVLIGAAPLNSRSGHYEKTFERMYTLSQLERLGTPEDAAAFIYSKYPLNKILIPW